MAPGLGVIPMGEDSVGRLSGCRRSNAGGAGGEEGCQGTDLLFPVFLGGAWSSLSPSPQPETPEMDVVQSYIALNKHEAAQHIACQ